MSSWAGEREFALIDMVILMLVDRRFPVPAQVKGPMDVRYLKQSQGLVYSHGTKTITVFTVQLKYKPRRRVQCHETASSLLSV